MGNFFGNSLSDSGDVNSRILRPVQKRFGVFSNSLRHQLAEKTSDSVGSSSSFRSFSIQKSSTSFPDTTRTWFRIYKRKQKRNPGYSKTVWPVPNCESLFLPEFKKRDDVTENSFLIIDTISSGAFGKVFKVIKHDSNAVYAMKVLSKAQLVTNNSINQVKEEVKIQQLVGHHPFIVNCPFYWQSRKQIYIVSEFISGGELSELLLEKGPLPVEVVRLYTAQLAVTLDFLHNAGIVYRDLKLENILLNSRGNIQLIDFGLSKWLKFGSRTNTICGTLQYIAPEILLKQPYGHAVDWWSLGIVIICMTNGECPDGCSIDESGRVRPTPEPKGGKEIGDLVNRLLVPEPSARLRFFGARRNPLRRRPFSVEDKTKEGRSVATACEMLEERYCRICFDEKKKEVPITPCRCKIETRRIQCRNLENPIQIVMRPADKVRFLGFFLVFCNLFAFEQVGTIGLVHMSCLEKWLSMSNTHSCELCGYNFKTLRTPKYRVLYSIYYWVFLDRNPQYHRGLRSDFIVFIVLTPIAFIGVYSCIVAADFYSKEPTKYSPASRWTTISLLIMVVLLTFAYYLWVAVTIRFHMRIWYIWWQANNTVKVMPRDPNTNSLERVPLSVQSSLSRRSNRRLLNDTSSSHADSNVETQPVAQGITV